MSSRFQRGYNLVEIAIVLAVVLMMSSWLVTNYYEVQRDQRVKETLRTIESAKAAIADYTISHRSQSFLIANSALPAAERIFWRVPSGRPYLPCPDITGDGMEDRQPFANITVTVAAISYEAVKSQTQECFANKGFLPWRTLNIPEASADAWGNLFTYRVDPDFAYSLLGFDQETTADDSSDLGTPAQPPYVVMTVTVGTLTQPLIKKSAILAAGRITAAWTGSAAVASVWASSNAVSENAPSLICDRAPCFYQSPASVIVYGEINSAPAVTLQVGGNVASAPVMAEFPNNSIISGLPVVVLSHGPNGFGAVSSQQDRGHMYCNSDIPAANQDEMQNAMRDYSSSRCATIAPSAPSRTNGFVVSTPREPGAPGGEFDDIVGWMTSEELAKALNARGVFPVDKLPPLGLEGY